MNQIERLERFILAVEKLGALVPEEWAPPSAPDANGDEPSAEQWKQAYDDMLDYAENVHTKWEEHAAAVAEVVREAECIQKDWQI